jgi:hypothetical protein
MVRNFFSFGKPSNHLKKIRSSKITLAGVSGVAESVTHMTPSKDFGLGHPES